MNTVGELYDSIAPGQSVYLAAHGQTRKITRPDVPAVDEGCTTCRRPVEPGFTTCRVCDDAEERIYERGQDV